MIIRVCLLILALFTLAGAEYDDNLLWRYSFSASNIGYSKTPDRICQKSCGALFLHTNPYRLKDLNWDYTSANLGFGKWGVSGSFRSYRLAELYNDIQITVGGAYRFHRNLYLFLETGFGHEKFGESIGYDRNHINFQIQYSIRTVSIQVGLDQISVKKPYRIYDKIAQPFVICNLLIRENSRLLVGYEQAEKMHGKWLLSQALSISDNLSLDLGYLTYPAVLQCGLDLRWKNITFSIIYQGMDKLDDTIIWGLSTGK